ncbi:MAG TPA: hypothetical protein VMF32_05325 [Xanthobacteraceae bacterium]|nr:hypothetical protein [Xanthobacteraceae bacterium]
MTRMSGTSVLLLTALIVLGSAMTARPAAAAPAYCPNPAHSRPAKVPPSLVSAVAAAFNVDKGAAPNTAFVRCVGPKLLGCYVGANLDCDKANTRRVLPGATAWCRQNPGATNIPMVATGHDTIYEWSCSGTRAVAGRQVMKVDPQGYIADNWKEIQ